MITEKMIEAAKAEAKALADRAGIDIGDDRDMFVDDLAQTLTRFVALSTDAEPVAHLRPCTITMMRSQFKSLSLSDKDHPKSFPVYAAPPAPSVAVKSNLVDTTYLRVEASALSAQVQDVAVFGPFAHLNGVHGLNEEFWTVDSDPDKNDDERFTIPLYSLVDPFAAAPAAKQGEAE